MTEPTATADVAAPQGPPGTIPVNVVLLTIKKKTHDVPVRCIEHEVPILRTIHPDSQITIVDDAYGVEFIDDSAEQELGRLCSKYDDKHNKVVALVYRSLEDLAAKVGLANTYDPLALHAKQADASVQNDPGAAKRKAAAAALRDSKKGGKRAGTGKA